MRQLGPGPSIAGLRPLSWLSRWPTTSEGVCSEQENAYHGDSRSGVSRGGHCATAVPSLRHRPGRSRSGLFGPLSSENYTDTSPILPDF